MLVLPVPLGAVQHLRDGGAGPEAEGDTQPVLPAAGPEHGPHEIPGRTTPGVQVPVLPAPVEGFGGVQQGVVEGAQGGRGAGGCGEGTGVGVAAYGGGEAPGAFGGAGGHGFAGPGERGGGLA